MKFFIVLKIFDFKIIFFECVIFYMEVILINKKRIKKKNNNRYNFKSC